MTLKKEFFTLGLFVSLLFPHLAYCDGLTIDQLKAAIENPYYDLLSAVREGKEAEVKRLFSQGLNVNYRYPFGKTLLEAAVNQGSFRIAEYLIEKGADVNAQDVLGNCVLLHVVEYKKRDLIDLLLRHPKINPNLEGSFGYSAIMYAARNKDTETVLKLIQKGADINAKDAVGSPVLHQAVFYQAWDAVVLLLQAGADIHNVDRVGRTLLHIVAGDNLATDLLSLLLRKRVEIDRASKTGVTPFMVAAYYGVIPHMEILLAHGAQIDKRDRNGRTALMWAVRKRRREGVKYLIGRRANRTLADLDGKTPSDVARVMDEKEIEHLLNGN